MGPLLLGIVSSLVATALFIGASELVRKVVLPWYADRVYRGVRVHGDWELIRMGEHEDISSVQLNLHLLQSGDKVTGSYTHKWKNEPRDTYDVVGAIRDGYFLAIATPSSRRQMDGISMLLYIRTKQNELHMTGSLLHCGDPGQVKSFEGLTFRLVST